MKKQFGIWLDFREANIIELTANESKLTKVNSSIDSFHPKGGSHSKLPWGATEKISERKYLDRRKQQENDYYQRLIKALWNADELYIFGPAEAKKGLLTKIQERTDFKVKVRAVKKADSITDNQKIAEVKSFFQGINEV